MVAFVRELTKETIHLTLGCLQGGYLACIFLGCIALGRFLRCCFLENGSFGRSGRARNAHSSKGRRVERGTVGPLQGLDTEASPAPDSPLCFLQLNSVSPSPSQIHATRPQDSDESPGVWTTKHLI